MDCEILVSAFGTIDMYCQPTASVIPFWANWILYALIGLNIALIPLTVYAIVFREEIRNRRKKKKA